MFIYKKPIAFALFSNDRHMSFVIALKQDTFILICWYSCLQIWSIFPDRFRLQLFSKVMWVVDEENKLRPRVMWEERFPTEIWPEILLFLYPHGSKDV